MNSICLVNTAFSIYFFRTSVLNNFREINLLFIHIYLYIYLYFFANKSVIFRQYLSYERLNISLFSFYFFCVRI